MKLDVSSAFYAIRLNEKSRKLTGIVVPPFNGETSPRLYRYKYLPQGHCRAPEFCMAFFSIFLKEVRQAYPNTHILWYMDDVFFSGKDVAAAHARLVQLLNKAGININRDKTSTQPVTSIEWLGMLVKDNSLALTPRLKEKITKAHKHLKDVKNVRSFKSLMGLL